MTEKTLLLKTNKDKIKSAIAKLISQNRLLFFLYTFSIIGGIIAGCITYKMSDTESVNKIFSYIQNYFIGSVLIGVSSKEVFISVLADNLKLTTVLFASALSVFLCPLAFIRIFSKGFSIGMTAAFFISRYMIKGAVFSVLSIFLCNAIAVPAIIIFSAYSTSESIKIFKYGRKRNLSHITTQNPNYIRFILKCAISALILLIVLVISSLIQGFVSPGMMKIFYTLLKS